MWNRISGNSNSSKDDTTPQENRRKSDDQRSTLRNRDSVASSTSRKPSSRGDDRDFGFSSSNKKPSSRVDDSDRSFNPSSTSYSSTPRNEHTSTADPNAGLANQMPKLQSSRGEREVDDRSTRDERSKEDRRSDRKEKKEKRDKTNKDKVKDRGSGKSESLRKVSNETTRGPADFPDQVGSVGFSQSPGQYDAIIPGTNGIPLDHPMSFHVQDQFPGQFPTQSTVPYRPPMAVSEGGPGLAAEYYGDAGQSVAEQPGRRLNSPTLIIGKEPHLQAASAVAAPPPEPSASGGIGAAASFFNDTLDDHVATSSQGHNSSATYSTAPSRPHSSYHTSSAPIIPTASGLAMGAASGYFMSGGISSHQEHPHQVPSVEAGNGEYSVNSQQQPLSQMQDSSYSSTIRPPKPVKPISQSSNLSMYAAEAAGAAGLAAAAYHQSHHSSQQAPSTHQYPAMSMAHRHRNPGPLNTLVDFFRDPEGVAQFEEYSEFIGVCKHCFAPGSSPRDAPRKHHYSRRRANEQRRNTRIDKESRYFSSENEGRRKKDKNWLATGLAGFGVAKVGESLFRQKSDFDDTYSVKTGRYSPENRHRNTQRPSQLKTRRRSQSQDRNETGITSDGKVYKKESRDGLHGDATITMDPSRRLSRSRSRSKDRKKKFSEAALGTTNGSSAAPTSNLRRRSRSPKGKFVGNSRGSRDRSSGRRDRSHQKQKGKGFFSFINASSSSSSVDLALDSERRTSTKKSNVKSKNDEKAEAALLGLGAAVGALALNDARKKKGVRELVGVKETKEKHRRHSTQDQKSDEEVWESAQEDDYESANSDLAYGATRRRRSYESFSSDSSGTNKWGWRWGSKKTRKPSPSHQQRSEYNELPTIASEAVAGSASISVAQADQWRGSATESTGIVPLQHVYPVPTSDPTRFEVGRDDTFISSNRPKAVPIQHPQPITPVSASLYSSQAPYEHSYSAPAGPPVFSHFSSSYEPSVTNRHFDSAEHANMIISTQTNSQAGEKAKELKRRRRDSSPARFETESMKSSMTPRRRTSNKEDSSVRFDLTEEQEESNRRERRQKRKEERERREIEEQKQEETDIRAAKSKDDRSSESQIQQDHRSDQSSANSWVGPVAAGAVGAAIGAAVAVERSKSEETREERRERRRREREREEAEEEESARRRERRRRDRERSAVTKESQQQSDRTSEVNADPNHAEPQKEKEISVWKSPSHENYGDFFRPLDFINSSQDQEKVTSANTNADVDLDQAPVIVTVEPPRARNPDEPEFAAADIDENIDPSKLSFPWQVPRLRLVQPTPPPSRATTPILQAKDRGNEDIEAPLDGAKPSETTWEGERDQRNTARSLTEEHEDPDYSGPKNIEGTDHSETPRSLDHNEFLPDQKERKQAAEEELENEPTILADDVEFAATLAASAEDAGFDPNVVINDPTYRRRNTPPGSEERSMPGGFDDDELRLLKRERKKKKKPFEPQNLDERTNGRDDDAIVKDIVSQVESTDPQPMGPGEPNEVPVEGESRKQSKSKKSKRSRKESGVKDESVTTTESASGAPVPETREIYDSPGELVSLSTSNAPNNSDWASKKSRKKSKHGSTGPDDDDVSSISSPSIMETSKESTTGAKVKKGSLWDRVLGRSTDKTRWENGLEDTEIQSTLDDIPKPRQESEQSQEHRSISDDFVSISQDSGRITQDLPGKDQGSSTGQTSSQAGIMESDLYTANEPELQDEQQSESFLGMRPEPPPPPDIDKGEVEPLEQAAATSHPASPRSRTKNQIQDMEGQIPDHFPLPTSLPSPTAVPFHFRRPRPSSGAPRPLSYSPPTSDHTWTDLTPRQKRRPRSTEFKSSKEFRPLWLVERHSSHQEPTPREPYPSLPSSHTSSRSSSVQDTDELKHEQQNDYAMLDSSYKPQRIQGIDQEMNETSHDFLAERSDILLNSDVKEMQSDILDSQQTTPTAATFDRDSDYCKLPPLPDSRAGSPGSVQASEQPHPPHVLQNVTLSAAVGGLVAAALSETAQFEDVPSPNVPYEEAKEFRQSLDNMTSNADNSLSNDVNVGPEDFFPQIIKKGKKNKKKANKEAGMQSPNVENEPRLLNSEPKTTDMKREQRIEEQDTQDAVDSWFDTAPLPRQDETIQETSSDNTKPRERASRPGSSEVSGADILASKPTDIPRVDSLTPNDAHDQDSEITVAITSRPDNSETELLPPLLSTDQTPNETPQERRQSKSKGKKGRTSRKGLVQDVTALQPPSITGETSNVEPSTGELQMQASNIADAEDVPKAAEEQSVEDSPKFELSPKSTALPYNDDLDLLEEEPTFIPEAADHPNKPLSQESLYNERRREAMAREVVAQSEQESRPSPTRDTGHRIGDSPALNLKSVDKETREGSSVNEDPNATTDQRVIATQNLSKTAGDEEAEMLGTEANNGDLPTEEVQALEDDSGDHDSNRQEMTAERAIHKILTDESTKSEEKDDTPPIASEDKEMASEHSRDVIDEPSADVLLVGKRSTPDGQSDFNTKKKGKKGKEQRMQVLDIEPTAEQFAEKESKAVSSVQPPSTSADATGEVEDEVARNAKSKDTGDPSFMVSDVGREVHNPEIRSKATQQTLVEDQEGSDQTPEPLAEKSSVTVQPKVNETTPPVIDNSSAATDTAQAVQDILHHDDAQSLPSMPVPKLDIEPSAVDAPSDVKEIEEKEPEWDAPKKRKKAKKGTKREIAAFDEAEDPLSAHPSTSATAIAEQPNEQLSRDNDQEAIGTKKGKKAKKSKGRENSILDEPRNDEAALTTSPRHKSEPLLEQEPAIEEDDVPISKKTKKSKKNKKNAVFSWDEPESDNFVQSSQPREAEAPATHESAIEETDNMLSEELAHGKGQDLGDLKPASDYVDIHAGSPTFDASLGAQQAIDQNLSQAQPLQPQDSIVNESNVERVDFAPPSAPSLSDDPTNAITPDELQGFIPPKSKKDKKKAKRSKGSLVDDPGVGQEFEAKDISPSQDDQDNKDKIEADQDLRQQAAEASLKEINEPGQQAQYGDYEPEQEFIPLKGKKDKKKGKKAKKGEVSDLASAVPPQEQPLPNINDISAQNATVRDEEVAITPREKPTLDTRQDELLPDDEDLRIHDTTLRDEAGFPQLQEKSTLDIRKDEPVPDSENSKTEDASLRDEEDALGARRESMHDVKKDILLPDLEISEIGDVALHNENGTAQEKPMPNYKREGASSDHRDLHAADPALHVEETALEPQGEPLDDDKNVKDGGAALDSDEAALGLTERAFAETEDLKSKDSSLSQNEDTLASKNDMPDTRNVDTDIPDGGNVHTDIPGDIPSLRAQELPESTGSGTISQEELQTSNQESFMPTRRKKDKKKKKLQGLSLDDDFGSPIREEAIRSEVKESEKGGLQERSPHGEEVNESRDVPPDLPQTSKSRKKAKKTRRPLLDYENMDTPPADDALNVADDSALGNEVILEKTLNESTSMDEPQYLPNKDQYYSTSADSKLEKIPDDAPSTPYIQEQAPSKNGSKDTQDLINLKSQATSDISAFMGPNPESGLEMEQENEMEAKTIQAITRDDVEIEEEPAPMAEDRALNMGPDAPIIVPISQNTEEWSPQERMMGEIKPDEVVEPGEEPIEASQIYEIDQQTRLPDEHVDPVPVAEVDQRPDSTMGAKAEGDQFSPDASRIESSAEVVDPMQPKNATSDVPLPNDNSTDNLDTNPGRLFTTEAKSPSFETLENIEDPTQRSGNDVTSIDKDQPTDTNADDVLWDMPVKKGKRNKKQRRQAFKDVIDSGFLDPSSTTSVPDAENGSFPEQPMYDQSIEENIAPEVGAEQHGPSVDPLRNTVDSQTLDEPEQHQFNQEYMSTQKPQSSEISGILTADIPTSAAGLHVLEAQEQREYDSKDAKEIEQQDSEITRTPITDLPTPAAEVQMLDAQQQREYDDEYARELERQLGSLQAESSDISPDQLGASMASQPSTESMMGMSFEQHRPLAKPPPLEDIIEETRSRAGSAQDNLLDQEESFPTLKTTKKGKKGKKNKKQQEPIIWEDETATPPVHDESEQTTETATNPPPMPGGWETGDRAHNVPINLEESMDQGAFQDGTVSLQSREFSQPRESHEQPDNADDYFTMKPNEGAEKDVGRSQTDEEVHSRSLSIDQQQSSQERYDEVKTPQDIDRFDNHAENRNRAYEEQTFADDPMNVMDSHTTEAARNDDQAQDQIESAPTKKSKKAKKSKRKQPELEQDLPSPVPKKAADQSNESETPILDSPGLGALPRESIEEPSRSPYATAEGAAASGEKLESIEKNAPVVGLAASAIVAEGISRRDSKKAAKKGKKGKKASKWTDFEEEPPGLENEPSEQKSSTQNLDQMSPRMQAKDVLQQEHIQLTPPQSPPPTLRPQDHPHRPDVDNSYEPAASPSYRDSAIHISDSPVILEDVAAHRAVRDSGFPDTELSPVVDVIPQDKEIQDEEDIGAAHRQESDDPGAYDHAHEKFSRHDSVEIDPRFYDTTFKPKESHKRPARRSDVAYDSDDSANSGFDIQRRRRLQSKQAEVREPSPVSSTTKDRSSALFDSSPSAREKIVEKSTEHVASARNDHFHEPPSWSFDRPLSSQPQSPHTNEGIRQDHTSTRLPDIHTPEKLTGSDGEAITPSFGETTIQDDGQLSPPQSPPSESHRGRRQRLNTISEDEQERTSLHRKDKRMLEDIGSPEAGVKERRMQSPSASDGELISTEDLIARQAWPEVDEDKHSMPLERSKSRDIDQQASHPSNVSDAGRGLAEPRDEGLRMASVVSGHSDNSVHAIIRTPDHIRSASGQSYRSSGTPPLRRVDRSVSGDLRSASKASEAKLRARTSEAELDQPNPNIPSSSTYDPVTDKGKGRANMADVYEGFGDVRAQSPMSPTRPPSMRKRQSMQLLDLETRLDRLVSENRLLQSQKSTAERNYEEQARDHSQQRHAYEEAIEQHKTFLSQKESELAQLKGILGEWQSKVAHLTEVNEDLTSSRRAVDGEHEQRYAQLQAEHVDLRQQHTDLSAGMEALVSHEVSSALEDKNVELRHLQEELENAKQQVRNLQQQLLASRSSEDYIEKDEDYFDSQCQSLCQHVQQWVLRFSKFSDMKACYRPSEIRDEKMVDRMENAILDDLDVEDYLLDRVKRRDVFMSVVMTMVWEYIFTRYLFGMDREQRQKLKNLEKILQEVGPISAVHKWRATTLTLLMKREAFASQRATDSEAVVNEIYDTLATFLPPPSHLVNQIRESLRKVINAAIDLSIEMRTQRTEYSMLPPLQPEYDTNGDLARKVYFSALTMNERSGTTISNEALQEQRAVVKMVLFPLVVKNEDDDEQIVVCPAQVLTADSKGKKTVRVMSAQGGRSAPSVAGSDVYMEGGMI